jgi:hypothetical protein
MRELYRVLKANGNAIMQVPISACLQHTTEDPYLTNAKERKRRFGQHDHVRIYGADYPRPLAESGFNVEVFDPLDHWGSSVLQEFRLNRREKIYLGKK